MVPERPSHRAPSPLTRKQDPLAQDPGELATGLLGLGPVVGPLHEDVVERSDIAHVESVLSEEASVLQHGSVLLDPLLVEGTRLGFEDRGEVAGQQVLGRWAWDVCDGRDVVGVDVQSIDGEDEEGEE